MLFLHPDYRGMGRYSGYCLFLPNSYRFFRCLCSGAEEGKDGNAYSYLFLHGLPLPEALIVASLHTHPLLTNTNTAPLGGTAEASKTGCISTLPQTQRVLYHDRSNNLCGFLLPLYITFLDEYTNQAFLLHGRRNRVIICDAFWQSQSCKTDSGKNRHR